MHQNSNIPLSTFYTRSNEKPGYMYSILLKKTVFVVVSSLAFYISMAQPKKSVPTVSALPDSDIPCIVEKQQGSVIVKWNMFQDTLADQYKIEYSMDASNWTTIAVIPTPMRKQGMQYYSFIHDFPSARDNYYRVTQMQTNGTEIRSSVQHISFTKDVPVVRIKKDTVENGFLDIELKEAGPIYIYSSAGQLLFQKNLKPGPCLIDIMHFGKGAYYVKDMKMTQKIVLPN